MRFLLTIGLILAFSMGQGWGQNTACTDPDACNYNPEATEDDGSCMTVQIETNASEVCEGEGITAQAFVNSVLASFEEGYATVNETASMLVVPSEYESVQAALSASSDGDTILVMPGQYIGTYDFPQTHGIHLISAEGPSATVLDGNNSESVIAINGEFEYSVKGFTITRGRAYQYSTICNGKMGGGMEICGANTIVNVEDNFIVDNLGRHRGGGIRVASPNCVVKRNVIAFNTMPQGWASYDGGAGVCIQASDITFENNTVAFNNDSGGYPYGSGVHMNAVEGGSFRNNIIFHNQGGPAIWRDSEAIVPIEFCNVDQDIPGDGNLNSAPLFEDPENNDFHLREASPCIDAGDPSTLDPDGTVSDLGAFPFYQASSGMGVNLVWSTGDTTSTIQFQPETSTVLEVQATLNGVSCSTSTEIIVHTDGCADEDACNYNANDYCSINCVYPLMGDDCEAGAVACAAGTVWDAESQTCVVANPAYLNEPGEAAILNPCYFDSNGNGLVEVTDLMNVLSVYGMACGEIPEAAEFSCGDPLSYQGYDYETVLIGEQCWFAENLRSENYTNGEAIENVIANLDWYNALDSQLPAVCNNLNAFCESNDCGMLYNRFAVEDDRGVCPTGWAVPTDSVWMQLESELGLTEGQISNLGWRGTDQGTMLKSESLWNGTNLVGFNARPEGHRSDIGLYSNIEDAHFWGRNPGGEESWYRMVNTNESRIYRPTNANPAAGGGGSLPRFGFSVRCVKAE